MKLWSIIIVSLLTSYSCFAMWFGIPKPSKKIKYKLDFSKLENLDENSFNDNFLKEVLEKMDKIKYNERKWGGGEFKEYIEYSFRDEEENSSLIIRILPHYSTEEAHQEFERKKSVYERMKFLYKNKKESKINYYSTYMNQWRTDPEGGSKLLDMYTTNIGIQNGSILIKIEDFSDTKDKKKAQKYIDMFVEIAEKHSSNK